MEAAAPAAGGVRLSAVSAWSAVGETHEALLLCLLAASVLFAVLAWVLWFRRRKQEQRYYEDLLLSNAIPMYHINEQGEYILNTDL